MKDQEQLYKELYSRFLQLQTERQKFQDRWTEAQEYCDRVVLSWDELRAIPEKPKRYSSLPCNYLNILVNGLVGYSISPNIVWFKLAASSSKLQEAYGVKKWLSAVEDIMLAKFNASNLYQAAAKMVWDAAVIGHGILQINEDVSSGRLRFTKIPANEAYLDINEFNEVDTVFRRYYLTIKNAVNFFGEDKLDEDYREAYKEIEHWNDTVEIIQAVMPRKDFNPEFKNAKNKPIAVYWLDPRHNKIIDESGYDTFPFAIFEWDMLPDFAYSTSPAQNAMPDIKGLNIAKKTSWQIAQTSAEPPMKVSEDIRQVNITPRGFTYVSSADQTIEPIRTGENYPITLEVLADMKQDIKDWFNVDFFLMLQSKQGKMTATEVMELQGEKAATLATLIVNLNDALFKIIEQSFSVLLKAGAFPQMPLALQRNGSLKIDFMGPLAQAQKKYHTMGGIVQATQVASGIMQMFPNSGDFIDGDELMRSALEGQGMPANVIREEDDVKKLRTQRLEMQQAQQQQQQQVAMAQSLMQNANKLNEPVQENSLIAGIGEQMAGALNG
jgi:hypothetical protein